MPAELELGVDPLLERGHAQLVQPRRLAPRERLVGEIGQRRAAPERERLAQQRRPRAPPRRRARLAEQPLEAVRVDALAARARAGIPAPA